MFVIRCFVTGNEAEAYTPEAALLAANTLVEDAVRATPYSPYLARQGMMILLDGELNAELTYRARHPLGAAS